MKKYIKTIYNTNNRTLWDNEHQKEALREELNGLGFYVLTGVRDSLDVYAIESTDPIDVRMINAVKGMIWK